MEDLYSPVSSEETPFGEVGSFSLKTSVTSRVAQLGMCEKTVRSNIQVVEEEMKGEGG